MSSNNANVVDTRPDDIKAAKLGKYGSFFLPEPTQQCGYIMATMSVIMLLGGATLETLSLAKLYGEYNSFDVYGFYGSYSFISYSGYWGGAVILLCASVTIRGASHPSDVMVGAVFCASLLGLTFSLVTIILPAIEWAQVVEINTLCFKCSAGQMLFAAYGVILACSSLVLIASILLGIITVQTIIAGHRISASNTGINETMMLPMHPHPRSDVEMADKTDVSLNF